MRRKTLKIAGLTTTEQPFPVSFVRCIQAAQANKKFATQQGQKAGKPKHGSKHLIPAEQVTAISAPDHFSLARHCGHAAAVAPGPRMQVPTPRPQANYRVQLLQPKEKDTSQRDGHNYTLHVSIYFRPHRLIEEPLKQQISCVFSLFSHL